VRSSAGDVPQGSWLIWPSDPKENVKFPSLMSPYRLFDPFIPHKAIEKGELDIWEMCRP